MILHIKPSSVNGIIDAPASKSYMQRAIVASMLSDGTSILENSGLCDDTVSVIEIAKDLGSTLEIRDKKININGAFHHPNKMLNCKESGLALRMLTPVISLFTSNTKITGVGSLIHRPLDMILDSFSQLNIPIETNEGKLPLTIGGNLKGGYLEIDGSKGSQIVTGFLMALPLAQNDSKIVVHDLKSKPYIDITLDILNAWNIQVINHDYIVFNICGNQHYKPTKYVVEGDWSSAAFMLVAGAIAGRITIRGLNINSKQADKKIIEVLNQVGSDISFTDNMISVNKNSLHGFNFDATHCPDLFPPLIALAVHCNTISTIEGVHRLFSKESNRAETLVDEFTKLGADISISGDSMIIHPRPLQINTVNSHNDHRIAMAVAIAGLCSNHGVDIEGFECISKSYPNFYTDLKTITQQ